MDKLSSVTIWKIQRVRNGMATLKETKYFKNPYEAINFSKEFNKNNDDGKSEYFLKSQIGRLLQ